MAMGWLASEMLKLLLVVIFLQYELRRMPPSILQHTIFSLAFLVSCLIATTLQPPVRALLCAFIGSFYCLTINRNSPWVSTVMSAFVYVLLNVTDHAVAVVTGYFGIRALPLTHLFSLLLLGGCLLSSQAQFVIHDEMDGVCAALIVVFLACIESMRYFLRATHDGAAAIHFSMILLAMTLGLPAFYAAFRVVAAKRSPKPLESRMEVDLNDQLTLLRGLYEQTQRLEHDLCNHFMVISGYCKLNDISRIQKYIEEIAPKQEQAFVHVGSPVLDVMLGAKKLLAEKHGIAFESLVQLPRAMPLNDSDLCVVFSNLLDNALEAARGTNQRARFIRVEASVNDGLWVISCSNSAGPGRFHVTGHLHSTKTSGVHGIGTKQIVDIARRAGGQAAFRLYKRVFTAEVLLRCDVSAENAAAS